MEGNLGDEYMSKQRERSQKKSVMTAREVKGELAYCRKEGET